MTQIFNTQKTKETRRALRNESVSAEIKIWGRLRKRQLGYRFNRQYGIGQFIVDFYCAEKRLVIEIDGATHSTEEELNYDRAREEYLKDLGLRVKRYTNLDVYDNLDLVVGDILDELKNPPQPSLS